MQTTWEHNDKEDQENALIRLLEIADAGDIDAMFFAANMYFHGWHVSRDREKAYRYFKGLYDLGSHAKSCFYLGLYEEKGYLHAPDHERAALYYKQGVEAGNVLCPANLGRLYCLGIGVDEDREKGVEYYKTGYERGDMMAATTLGYCFENGFGVEADMSKAIEYYEAGARKNIAGCIKALERLGISPKD